MISTAPNSNYLADAARAGTLTPHQIQRMMGGDAWRLTPATYAARIAPALNTEWHAARHLRKASAEIAQAIYKGGARLLVAWPPRHGKSEMLSVYTPMWHLDLFPNKKVAMASYGEDLITDFSVRVRDNLIELENSGLSNVTLKKDQLRVNNFLTTSGGAVRAVGIGGPLTGRGAHLLLIDDYLKNAKDAMSKGIRDDIYDWFRAVAFTRLEPGGSVVIFAARWDVDDLAGRLERDSPGEWKVIRFAAVCDDPENDPLGREMGEPLWKERYDRDYLGTIERTLGKFFWSALYQQKPLRKVEGLTRDSFEIVTSLPPAHRMRWVRAWDMAATEDGGDFTVGTLIGEDLYNGLIYIADVIRGQWGPDKTTELVENTADADKRKHYTYITMEQEPGSAGKTVITQYQKALNKKGHQLKAMPSVGVGSKILRANGFIAASEGKVVKLLQGNWNSTWLDEIQNHPDCEPDDQRDSAAIGFNRLMEMSGHKATWGSIPPDQRKIMDKVQQSANDNTHRGGAGWGRRGD